MSGNNLELQLKILKKYKESCNAISSFKEERPVAGFIQ